MSQPDGRSRPQPQQLFPGGLSSHVLSPPRQNPEAANTSKSPTAAGCGNCDVPQATTELDRVQNFDNL
ncbi:MAG: hypothetical protein JGK17_01035 [Microcoleus sp. PH2017_10_PVI_O_A]|uniref:hypothetical protein n=1 Tax=unclassified Microcoleus TaxID=2642155 RepID=UPI001D2C5FFF|nr:MULTISPECIES: hypothetical protein [unclassified Microcoleus]TAE85787.1 MAG: hypothetical protein EAZ83_01670 [Oscillatoriales cyanobacterium]MCC3404204.1 hypothetical protein [Microcoleus sp. PH2017_10_PVI_O_A]MCC3458291.1 hypothetical protein [Microcoleus sp. PH2017_11_PCY_U_A]MCC3478362.1 hypothetical protein [Microcoleus sp. PH2017_12_PCY_D_A]MCC3527236.1 hypothetical protein [Microcoleus sp. PH2017_21_RUC_O_A]